MDVLAPQVLKLLRYTVKLSLVSVLKDSDTPLTAQLRSLESSVGTTRQARLHLSASAIIQMCRPHFQNQPTSRGTLLLGCSFTAAAQEI